MNADLSPLVQDPAVSSGIWGVRHLSRFITKSPERYNAVWAYLMLTPFLIGLVVFIVGPLLFVVAMSFTEWSIVGQPKWIGLANYREMFGDKVFQKSFWNTLYYTGISVPVSIILSILLATLMNRPLRGINLLRAIYFSPITISVIAVCLLWSWLYTPSFGFLNYVLSFFGIPPVNWLVKVKTAMLSLIIVGVWRSLGFNIIVFLAGLKSIPKELYDASTIDGANEWQQFWRVTLPMLTPTIFFAVIMAFIASFQVFEQTYIMTQGGPSDSTTTLIYNMYLQGFTFQRMGFASAIAMVFLVIVLAVTIVQIVAQDRWVFYDE